MKILNAASRVDPRACGENAIALRGAHAPLRLTPAHAGRIIAMNQASLKHWVDPRACGVKRLAQTSSIFFVGLTPRVRGEFSIFLLIFIELGLTPAHAGRI